MCHHSQISICDLVCQLHTVACRVSEANSSLQYILSVGTMTDTWEQLRLERVGNNLLWGAGSNQLKNPVEDAVGRPL